MKKLQWLCKLNAGRKPMLKNATRLFVLLLVLSFQQKKNFTSPPGYYLNKPEEKKLSKKLLEISGITFLNDKSDTMLAINDEEGKLFYFLFEGDKIGSTRFMEKEGDFEDITVFNNSIYVLKSNGTIIQFSKKINGEEIRSTDKHKNAFPEGEYESLYAEEETSKLYVLCKECPEDDESSIKGYYHDLKNKDWKDVHPFSIDLRPMTKKLKKNFKASAMTKNKRTNEWYILSSAHHILLVTDQAFNVKATYPIDPEIFNQPEGMAFDRKGNLYISNEGDKMIPGNVLRFKLNGK